jgi:hypothetical protein
VTASKQISLPLDAYELSLGSLITLDKAEAKLRRRCAARFRVVNTEPRTADLAVASSARRYGIADASVVNKWGYHAPSARASVTGDARWNPSAKEYLVMTGTRQDGKVPQPNERPRDANGRMLPPGGCAAEADRQLSGGEHVGPGFIEALKARTLASSERDSRVRAAARRWSDCMRDHGYAYDSPWQPNDTRWGDEPSPKERATAHDDLSCRRSVRLLDVWVAVDSAYQRSIEGAYAADLSRFKRISDDRIRRARAVVAGSQSQGG